MNLNSDGVAALVAFLTGGGALTLVAYLFRGIRTVRTGALSSTRAVVKDLVEARNEAEARRDQAVSDAEYFRAVAGGYAFQLKEKGFRPKPEYMRPPKLTADFEREARERRHSRDRDLEDSGDILA